MYLQLKRILDLAIATVAAVLLLPIFLIIMVAIRLDSDGPIFFIQKRVGLGKSHFGMIKFRTMYTETPSEMPTHLLNDPDRWITPVGKFLRKTSLDELPQLINILRGEMAIIGPRPALWNQFDLIEARDRYGANDVLPGLTGWAQVNGRDELPIAIKAAYDGEYVKQLSWLMDLHICFKSVSCVLFAEDYREGQTLQSDVQL